MRRMLRFIGLDKGGLKGSSANYHSGQDAKMASAPSDRAPPHPTNGSLQANPGSLLAGPKANLLSGAEEGLPTMNLDEDQDSCETMHITMCTGKSAKNPEALLPVLISVRTPNGTEREPADICCILDVSGSMGQEARIQGAGGVEERHGLSLLDIAKHGVRTIIHMLGSQDRLAIVAFNHEAIPVLGLTTMDESGQKIATEKLDLLMSGGGTHIWKGLESGLESLRLDAKTQGLRPGRFAHVMLLTDGESLEREQIVPNLLAYKERYNEQLPGTISTFGFGYSIDSRLLVNMANLGDGTYSFIPDAGFVGTVFVNTLSNLLCTMARETYLNLEVGEGAQVQEVFGDFCTEQTSWGWRIKMGTLQYGQSKDVMVVMSTAGPGYLTVGAQYVGPDGKAVTLEAVDAKSNVRPRAIAEHYFRSRFVDCVIECVDLMRRLDMIGYHPPIRTSSRISAHSADGTLPGSPTSVKYRSEGSAASTKSKRNSVVQAFAGMLSISSRLKKAPSQSGMGFTMSSTASTMDNLETARAIIARLGTEVRQSPYSCEQPLKGLLEDVLGQTTEAISCEAYYQKWGRHYLPSIMFAHKTQQCNNFKDPGVQLYGGRMFGELRDQADEIFDKLPPPQPSIRGHYGLPVPIGGSMPSIISMAAYNDRYAGCVGGDCLVRLVDGRERALRALAKGDRVAGPDGAVAEVVCLARSRCRGGRALLVELTEGLRVTPHHPVFLDGAWVFPCDVAAAREADCEDVFSFVLSGAPALVVDGVPCIALGHGLEQGAARHPYFGSAKAVEDLAALPGFEAGLVELPAGGFARDPATGLVCGLAPAQLH